jgi:CheY-like chemotaxis protein
MTKKILLADDSLTIQKVVELTFSDSEYGLICVPNGQRALDRVVEEKPDLILADVVMPEKNGYEVCEAIKSNPATARIPVVLLSGTFEPFDRDRAERLGCDAIVSKPFDSQQLLRQVEALLSRPPSEIPSTATMAIPIPNEAAPPPPAAPSPDSNDAGFAADDFTSSIRTPPAISGGTDLFEEEYGQGDVESAIAAFEKAHPEFSSAEEDARDTGFGGREESEAGEVELIEASQAPLETWLHDEPEALSVRPEAIAPPPAPFWVPREPEPEVQPIPFSAEDSGSGRISPEPLHAEPEPVRAEPEPLRAEPEPLRADEAPTQQIPLSHDYVSMLHRSPDESPSELDGGLSAPTASELDERTAEIPIGEYRPIPEAPSAEAAPSPAAAPEEPAPVSREIEVLAQTTSIGQLKEMLSSVSRTAGELTDEEIDRLATRVVERLSEKIVREIAWEVIPDVAELVIKQRIKELEAGVE